MCTQAQGTCVHSPKRLFETGVVRLQLADHEILRVVGPVTVGANPDLEQDGLALDDRQVSGRGERSDPAAGPHERERQRELHLPVPAGALAVHEALPQSCRLRLLHPDAELATNVLHRRRRDLVREEQPLDLLRRLAGARTHEERRRVGRLREGVEPSGREG